MCFCCLFLRCCHCWFGQIILTVETVGVADLLVDLCDALRIAALDFFVDLFESLWCLAVG
jgi:hypothetical protein